MLLICSTLLIADWQQPPQGDFVRLTIGHEPDGISPRNKISAATASWASSFSATGTDLDLEGQCVTLSLLRPYRNHRAGLLGEEGTPKLCTKHDPPRRLACAGACHEQCCCLDCLLKMTHGLTLAVPSVQGTCFLLAAPGGCHSHLGKPI